MTFNRYMKASQRRNAFLLTSKVPNDVTLGAHEQFYLGGIYFLSKKKMILFVRSRTYPNIQQAIEKVQDTEMFE